ncbi:energy transducer TonB [Emticicia sp. C21]|uniref:energy transducer TonB n=1 Tax=Emticicia sp. C21 TaxID=2302915 RepID=UPI000E7D466A|nr:hypothetical protein [Emticicia sp. C21]RFS16012.1 hypothetical protein D0T08_14045 [Emticicia sp. C21]
MKYLYLLFLLISLISCQKELNEVVLAKNPREKEIERVEIEDPVFKGGEKELFKYISTKIKSYGFKDDTCCKVVVRFSISAYGRVENVNILNGGVCLFKEELIKIFQDMPKWKPGMFNKESSKFVIYYLHQRKRLLIHSLDEFLYKTRNGP